MQLRLIGILCGINFLTINKFKFASSVFLFFTHTHTHTGKCVFIYFKFGIIFYCFFRKGGKKIIASKVCWRSVNTNQINLYAYYTHTKLDLIFSSVRVFVFQDRAGGHIQTINQQFNSIANTQYYQYIHICICVHECICVCVEYQTPFTRPTGCIGRLDSAGKRTLLALKRTANVRTKNIFYFNCSRTDERNYI